MIKVFQKSLACYAAIFALMPCIGLAQVVRQEKLQDVREQIVFPEMSLEEKSMVVDHAQKFLRDLYVHRFAKQDYYRDQLDPVPAIADVAANLENMTTAEMEEEIAKIFAAQRDLHLNYIFPSPYADYDSFIPLTFTRTAGRHFFEVRINSINAELFEKFAPGQRIPEVGDEVVRYNHKPAWLAAKRLFLTSQGANTFGGFTRALGRMAFVNHLVQLLPDDNEVTLLMRGSKNRWDFYRVTIPWIVQWTETPPGIMRQAPLRDRFDPKQPPIAEELLQKEYNRFLKENKLEPATAFPSNPSNEPTLTWGIIENDDGKFAYLRLTSFVPRTGVEATLIEIRRLLLDELSGTDGLIFDVRNNGGGYINLADSLPQFFKRTPTSVIEARLLNTELNRHLFSNTNLSVVSPDWADLMAQTPADNTYTDTLGFTSIDGANLFGQVYYKPVAVFANARSYSATDLFSCGMQDNNAGLLYGEDPRTGAGGANVVTSAYFNFYDPDNFPALPYGHRMRVSWRQSIRAGSHQGELIEDYGCAANRDVSKTKSDVIDGGELQLRKMTRSLRKRAKYYRAYAKGMQSAHQAFISGSTLSYRLTVAHTAYVKVMVNGQLHEKIPVFAWGQEKQLEVNLPADLSAGDVANVTFIGESWYGKTLWNLKREFVILGDAIEIGDDGFNKDFAVADDVSPLIIVNKNPIEDGWNLVPPYLQIGYNPQYTNNVDTSAVLLLDLSSRVSAKLTVDMEYDTEAGWDFVQIFVRQGNESVQLYNGSGVLAQQAVEFDLSNFAGMEDVVVQVRFVSDTNTLASGVKMASIAIE